MIVSLEWGNRGEVINHSWRCTVDGVRGTDWGDRAGHIIKHEWWAQNHANGSPIVEDYSWPVSRK